MCEWCEALRAILRDLEWSQRTTTLRNGGTIYTAITCPICEGEKDPPKGTNRETRPRGHVAGCRLAAALAGEGKGAKP